MAYYRVSPEVPGQLGSRTRLERGADGLRITYLHYEFDGWLGDELITSHPAFAVTRTLADRLREAGVSGFEFREMSTSRSPQFTELYAGRDLPEFVELVVGGQPGVDDFGIDRLGRLVLSEAGLAIVNTTQPLDLVVEPLDR